MEIKIENKQQQKGDKQNRHLNTEDKLVVARGEVSVCVREGSDT